MFRIKSYNMELLIMIFYNRIFSLIIKFFQFLYYFSV
jgi:hypothetical protein